MLFFGSKWTNERASAHAGYREDGYILILLLLFIVYACVTYNTHSNIQEHWTDTFSSTQKIWPIPFLSVRKKKTNIETIPCKWNKHAEKGKKRKKKKNDEKKKKIPEFSFPFKWNSFDMTCSLARASDKFLSTRFAAVHNTPSSNTIWPYRYTFNNVESAWQWYINAWALAYVFASTSEWYLANVCHFCPSLTHYPHFTCSFHFAWEKKFSLTLSLLQQTWIFISFYFFFGFFFSVFSDLILDLNLPLFSGINMQLYNIYTSQCVSKVCEVTRRKRVKQTMKAQNHRKQLHWRWSVCVWKSRTFSFGIVLKTRKKSLKENKTKKKKKKWCECSNQIVYTQSERDECQFTYVLMYMPDKLNRSFRDDTKRIMIIIKWNSC